MLFSNYCTLNNPIHFGLAVVLCLWFSNKSLYALRIYQRWARIRSGSDWIKTETNFGRIRAGSDCNSFENWRIRTGSDWENFCCFNVIILKISKILVVIRFNWFAKWWCTFCLNGTILQFKHLCSHIRLSSSSNVNIVEWLVSMPAVRLFVGSALTIFFHLWLSL